MSTLHDRLTRRPVLGSDAAFLRHLYGTTRASEMAMVNWTDAQKAAFLDQQFAAQHTYYHAQYPDADYDLLLLGGQPAGRLYVDRRPDEISVMDIALLPEHRGQGLGTALLKELISESEAAHLPLRLHVEAYNPAFRLYTRLGFTPQAGDGIYTLMERLLIPSARP